MGKVIASIWQTVDGVVDAATMDKWFLPFDSETRGNYIRDTIQNCEAMLYGRLTYELLSNHWSEQRNNEFGIANKLNSTKKYLVSTTVKAGSWGETVVIDSDVAGQIERIKHQTQGDILIQGSASLVKFLLTESLVDELRLLVHPYVAGHGKKLFDTELNQELVFLGQQGLDRGVILLTYGPASQG
ncbi:dihydrofolate reductase family protein [Hymenobacter koreensis]|uniref:Dihydrofolate reductase family protein n=1 Tax=Hymenobacter koreensis TaxID=1084523 RepID=A0ABP8IY05_9BACT